MEDFKMKKHFQTPDIRVFNVTSNLMNANSTGNVDVHNSRNPESSLSHQKDVWDGINVWEE